ncbi:MAG: hypothetical protein ACI80K_004762, partial [Paracoccaceae bacterium]
ACTYEPRANTSHLSVPCAVSRLFNRQRSDAHEVVGSGKDMGRSGEEAIDGKDHGEMR